MDNNLIDATPLEAYWGSTKLSEIWFNESRIWPAKGVVDSWLQLKFDPSSTSGWSAGLSAATSFSVMAYPGTKVHVTEPRPHGSNYDNDDVVFVLRMSSDGTVWTGNVTDVTSDYRGKGMATYLDGKDVAPAPEVEFRHGSVLTIAPTVAVGSRFVLVRGAFGSASTGSDACGYITIIE
jgi:hypothetical protein